MALSIPALLMLLAPIVLAAVMIGAIELIMRIETQRDTLQTRAMAEPRSGAAVPANDAQPPRPWDVDDRLQPQARMTWIEDGPSRRDPRAGRRR